METLKRFGRWLLLGAAALGALLLLLLRVRPPAPAPVKPPGLPETPKATEDAVRAAETQAAGERAVASTKAEDRKADLADAGATDDGAERRRKLADLANKT